MGDKADNPTKQFQDERIEVEDLEVAARENRHPRSAKRYRVRVDKTHLEFTTPTATGAQILERAGKTPPSAWLLFQRMRGNQRHKIDLDAEVDFGTPGVERFITMPREQIDGEG